MLTPREFQIANKILSAKADIRIKDLAEECKVSSRAIQYDLENVKAFLKKQDIHFRSNPGKGIWIECSEESRAAALLKLSGLQKNSVYFNQEMRAQRILLQLISCAGYVTAVQLAEKLDVSRGTILSDMEHVEMLLRDSGLILKRQVRWGYRLDGQEIALRALAEKLLQEGMSVYDIYQMINRLKTGILNDGLALPLSDDVASDYHLIEDAMVLAFKEQGAGLQKENIVLMVLRLLVSVSRMRMGRYVGNPELLAQEHEYYLYPYWEKVYAQNGLPVLKDELDYVKGRYHEEKLPVDVDALSADLVESVSRMESFPYYDDNTLYTRLLTHLRHDFSSEKMDAARNPFHDLILKNHPHLYKSIKTVCKKHIDSSYLFSNDSLISYLTLHFLTSQRNLGVGRKMRVIFVCATGRGAAKIIERMLEREIRCIEIIQRCSLIEVDAVIENTKPDFIISVFPIESAVPVVLVEPLPTKANIEAIRKLIDAAADENEFLCQSQTFNMGVDNDDPEEITQEVILVGMRTYAKLREDEVFAIKADMEIAFLSHVLLMASRYVFDKQFSGKSFEQTDLDLLIKNRLTEIGVHLTLDEIKALACYFQ